MQYVIIKKFLILKNDEDVSLFDNVPFILECFHGQHDS